MKILRSFALGSFVFTIVFVVCSVQTVYATTTFTAQSDGLWNDGETWGNTSPGVEGVDYPGPTNDVYIPDDTVITLDGDTTVHHVTFGLDGGAILNIFGHTLSVTGNWKNPQTGSGMTFNTGATGTVAFTGTADQKIFGETTFPHLTKTVAGSGGLLFHPFSTTTVTGTSSFIGAAGNKMVVKVDADAIPPVVNATWGASVTGGVSLGRPTSLVFNGSDSFFVADPDNDRILKVNATDNTIEAVLTGGTTTLANMNMNEMVVDAQGKILFTNTDSANEVVKLDPTTDRVIARYTVGASLHTPFGIAVDSDGYIYVSENQNGYNDVLKFDPATDALVTRYDAAGGLQNPLNLTLGQDGNIFVSDVTHHRIVEINAADDSVAHTYTGAGTLVFPGGMVLTGTNDADIIVTDSSNNNVVKIHRADNTVTSTYTAGSSLSAPVDMSLYNGDMYIADYSNSRVIRLNTSDTIVTTYSAITPGPGLFSSIKGVARNSSGSIYVSDCSGTAGDRIEKYTSTGTYESTIGSTGVDKGQFDCASALAIDSQNSLYVVDTNNSRIDKFDSDGAFVYTAGWGVQTGAGEFEICRAADAHCLAGIGGDGAGQFGTADGIATDSAGNVYVSDSLHNRVQKFDTNGNFVAAFGWGVKDGSSALQVCVVADGTCQAGVSGSGDGQFNNPGQIAIDSHDHIFIYDRNNYRIQEITTSGAFVSVFGWGVSTGESQFEICQSSCSAGLHDGRGDGQILSNNNGLGIDSHDNIYVAINDGAIEIFNSDHAYVTTFGTAGTDTEGYFNGVGQIVINANDAVYISDQDNGRVQKFIPGTTGHFALYNQTSSYEVPSFSTAWGSAGTTTLDMSVAYGIAHDASDNLFVADYGNNRILKYNSSGTFIASYTGDGDVAAPVQVAVDTSGYIYVVDAGVGAILKIDPATDTVVDTFTAGNSLSVPRGMAFNSSMPGFIFVADTDAQSVKKIDMSNDTLAAEYDAGSTLVTPVNIVFNDAGHLLVSDSDANQIVEINLSGDSVVATYTAGSTLTAPLGLAIDENGYIFSSTNDATILKINPADDSVVGTYHANGTLGTYIYSMHIDSAGNLFVADTDHDRVVKINLNADSPKEWWRFGVSGAGNGEFDLPKGIVSTPTGDVYVADNNNHRIEKLTGADGHSAPTYDSAWGNAPAGIIGFAAPHDVAVSASGYLFVSDYDNNRVVKVNPLTGTSSQIYTAGGTLSGPRGVVIDTNGSILVVDSGNARIVRINATTSVVMNTYMAGDTLVSPFGIALDTASNMYVVDTSNNTVTKLSHTDGSVVHTYSISGGLNGPTYIAITNSGDMVVSDTGNSRIVKIDPVGDTVLQEYTGNGEIASDPEGVVLNSSEDIIVALGDSNRILRISSSTDEVLTTYTASSSLSNPRGIRMYGSDVVVVNGSGNNVERVQLSDDSLVNEYYGPVPAASEFINIMGMARDSSGHIYVADCAAAAGDRIDKYDADGTYITTFGMHGRGTGKFNCPTALAFDSSDNLFVADKNNDRIVKINPAFNAVVATYTANGTLLSPQGIAVASGGDLFVSNTDAGAVVRIDPVDDVVIATSSVAVPLALILDASGNVFVIDDYDASVYVIDPTINAFTHHYRTIGEALRGIALDTAGNAIVTNTDTARIQKLNFDTVDDTFARAYLGVTPTPAVFINAQGVVADSRGYIYVSDGVGGLGDRIEKYDTNGAYVGTIGTHGSGKGEFNNVGFLAVDADDNIYVSDINNKRVQKFNSSGDFVLMFGWGVQTGADAFEVCVAADIQCFAAVASGTHDGEFSGDGPGALAVDASGNIYVTDATNGRFQKYNANGAFVAAVSSFDGGGFDVPAGIAIDSDDALYINDTAQHRIVKFNSSLAFVNTFGWGVDDGASRLQTCTASCQAGSSGNGAGQINSNGSIAVDLRNNSILVAQQTTNDFIQYFDADEQYQLRFGSYGSGNSNFANIGQMTVDSNGNQYIVDVGNYRIKKFVPIRQTTHSFTARDLIVTNAHIAGSVITCTDCTNVGNNEGWNFETSSSSGSDNDSQPVVTRRRGGGGGGGGIIRKPSAGGTTTTATTTAGVYIPVPGCPAGFTCIAATTGATAGGVGHYVFKVPLRVGMNHPDVKLLQKFLNSHGFVVAVQGPGALGFESTYFGTKTHMALVKFQEAHAKDILIPQKLKKGTGLFGISTMRFVNSMLK